MNKYLVFKIIISIWTHGNMQITVSGSVNLSICNTEAYTMTAFAYRLFFFSFFSFYLEAMQRHNLHLKNKHPLRTEGEKPPMPVNGRLISEQINRQLDQHLNQLNRFLKGS